MSHLNSHNGTKAFECTVCNKKLASQASLGLHQRYVLSRPLEIYVYETYHLRFDYRLHTGQRPYSCNYCGKQFRHRSYFKVHLQAHQRSLKSKSKAANTSEDPRLGNDAGQSNMSVTLAEPLELTESGNKVLFANDVTREKR